MPTVSDVFTLTIPMTGDTPTPVAPTLRVRSDSETQEVANGDEYTVAFVYTRGTGSLKAENSSFEVTFTVDGGSNVIVTPSATVTPLHTGVGDGLELNNGSVAGAVPFLTTTQLATAVNFNGVISFDY